MKKLIMLAMVVGAVCFVGCTEKAVEVETPKVDATEIKVEVPAVPEVKVPEVKVTTETK